MGLVKIGPCRICDRTCSCLNWETELCPTCEADPVAARERRFKFVAQVWFIYRPAAIIIVILLALAFDWLMRLLAPYLK